MEYTLLRQVFLLARREEGAGLHGPVTDEQRSQKENLPQPFGQSAFCPGASLLARHRSIRICSSLAPRPRPKFALQSVFHPAVWSVSFSGHSSAHGCFRRKNSWFVAA